MAVISDLFTLSRSYPIISIIIGVILFFIGLRVTAHLLKWVLWILSAIAVIAAIYMFFM